MLFTSVRPGAAGSRLAGLGTSRRPRRPQSRLSARAGNGRGMEEVDPRFIKVAQKAADAAGQVARKYFRYSPAMASIDLELKEDQSPVTIADREAEQAMRGVIENAFPEHTIYGEEFGAHLPGRESGTEEANLVWVLDPIDGTKSFITGKPLFGTLVSLVKVKEEQHCMTTLTPSPPSPPIGFSQETLVDQEGSGRRHEMTGN